MRIEEIGKLTEQEERELYFRFGVEDCKDCRGDKPENKYNRSIRGVSIDVYDILDAYGPTHPVGHAIKKLLMAGNRGAKSYVEDLSEAIQSIEREIEMQSGGS